MPSREYAAGVSGLSVKPAPRRPGARREIILGALSALLEDTPLAQLSVEQIAEASGITRQRFYHYFPTKYEALGALIDQVSDDLMTIYTRPDSWFVRPPHLTPREAVMPTFTACVEFWRAHGHVIREASDLWNLPESVSGHWYRFMERIVDMGTRQIERERELGVAPPGPDARTTAAMLLWMGERMLFFDVAHAPARVPIDDEAIAASADVFLRAVYLDDDPPLPGVSRT